jgi:argininosuccinate synthase
MQGVKKIVLAYSGGLDTSVMSKWIKETYKCEVVAFTADIGQGAELSGLEEKALSTGCSSIFIEDLRDEFVRDYVFYAVKAKAIYEGHYLLGTSVARPVIAKRQIEIAQKVGADAVAHGATGKGNDQVRFELTYYSLKPDINYAHEHRIPVTATAAKPYSMDANLMHISYEGGILEDPWAAPPDDIFLLTKSVEAAPQAPTVLTLSFERGVPVAINGEGMAPVALLTRLNEIAGEHGIGRVDVVENRFVGMKSRGVYETPGVTVLHQAHRALETLTLDRDVMRLRDSLSVKVAEMIYNGFWFAPEFQAIKGMIEGMMEKVTGDVRLKLYKGTVTTLGRRSPYSLYNEQLATFEADQVYNQADAEGFIKLNALRLRMLAQAQH